MLRNLVCQFCLVVVAAVAVQFASLSVVQASIVQLTGGDASGGLVLDPNHVVVAEALSGNPNATVQGVNFNSLASGVGFSYTANRGNFPASPNSVSFTGSDANDTGLLKVINEGLQFSDGGDNFNIEVTVTGLTPNAPYAVDSIVSLYGDYNPRSESISLTASSEFRLFPFLNPRSLSMCIRSPWRTPVAIWWWTTME